MSEFKKIGFWEYVIIAVKHKKMLLITFIASLVVGYLGVYFLIDEEFQSTATIVSVDDNSLGGIASLAKSFSSLPLSLGGVKKATDLDMYNTIITSRTCAEALIDSFKLQQVYGVPKRDEAIKLAHKLVKTEITLENAYIIKVAAKTPQLASDMTNYLVDYLNSKVVELNIAKARENRVFIEKRYHDVSVSIAQAEDSLKSFQQSSGILEAEDQMKATIETYARLEADVAAKQIETGVLAKLYGENSPQLENARVVSNEYRNKLESYKKNGDKSGLLLGLESLPQKSLTYFRLLRDVKLYNKMLEFIVPLYEQSKFDEQKEVPVLQVIDRAKPAERKSFPPRALIAGILAIAAVLSLSVYYALREKISVSQNPTYAWLWTELRSWK